MQTITQMFEDHVDRRWVMSDPKDSLLVMTVGLAGEAGEVCELIKKHVRDREVDFARVREELGDLLFYLARVAHQYGTTLDEIMAANMEKLANKPQKGYEAAEHYPQHPAALAARVRAAGEAA